MQLLSGHRNSHCDYLFSFLQASGNVSQLEAQVAGLQESLLQAKDLLQVKLQDALVARRQAEQQIRVRCGALAMTLRHKDCCYTIIKNA